MKNPKVIAEITDRGFSIKLENWDGVTNTMIERMHYAIVKESQVYRATKLGELHAVKMRAEADAMKKQEANGDKLIEELSNVLAPK